MTGSELAAARIALGTAQIDLARVLGVSEWAIWAWEKGVHPVPPGVKLQGITRTLRAETKRRKLKSAANRSRGLLRWMRENPELVKVRNRKVTSKLSREDRRELGRLTWAGTTHDERSAIASKRQRRRWRRIPRAQRSEYMSALNRLRWGRIPVRVRSKLMSDLQKNVWAGRTKDERFHINSLRVRKGWAKLSPAERSALMYERFWSWFPRADGETQARVMKVLRSNIKVERATNRT